MEATTAQLLHELETIRAFLFIIMFVCVGVLICTFIVMSVFVGGFKELMNMARTKHCVFREEAEELLAQNQLEKLLIEIEKRLKTHPNDAHAYYYQGKALYLMEKYHESKRSFDKAYELESGMDITYEIWTQRIKDKLKESSPKIVE